VSLKEQFRPDLDAVFTNPEEFGEVHTDPVTGETVPGRRFAIIENGVEREFVAACVWDKSEVQKRLIVQQQGVYWGDVMLYIAKDYFRVIPKPEEVIYTWEDAFNSSGDPAVSPMFIPKKAYRIVQVVEAEQCYEIALDKLIA
jgi:hypothetical protein